MAIALNEYATRAFSEHPVALWSLDDDAYFISRVADDNIRLFDLGNWTVSPNCILEDYPEEDNVDPAPFNVSATSMVSTLDPFTGEVLELISPSIFTFDQLNSSLKTFCMNFWLYQRTVGVIRYEVGYKYLNSSSQEVVIVDQIPASEAGRNSWINFNITDPIPTNLLPTSTFKIIIRIVLSEPVSENQEYKFIFNGLSVGQWSETSCYKNLGSIPITVPDLGFQGNCKGITADQYGVLSANAYYVIEDQRMLADNNGLSLVYGSENSTNLYPSTYGNPSFVFPGKDMLHETGRYKESTLEMWLQVDVSSLESIRIVGPLSSDFGVYIKKGIISLVVGDKISSHPIVEWYRPMLLHVVIQESTVSMIINGEQVASVQLDRASIELPDDLNWWGIYSYPEISQFKIDCISIYPYVVPLQVAKKRFVWGQGVETLQFIDSEFAGTTAAMDFTTSNYDVNMVYPDIGRWDAGFFDNLSVTQTSISLPNYSLPERYLGGLEGSSQARNIDDWYNANKVVNNYEGGEKFITFKPNVGQRFNYFYKPSLETLKWSDYGSSVGEFNTDYSFVGTKSLRVTLAGSDTSISGPHGFDDFEVNETGIYWASAYFYIPQDPLQQLDGKTITLTLEDGWQGVTVLETNIATLNLGQWTRASIKFSTTDTVHLGRIVARISENINGQKIYTDAWMLDRSTILNQYFDGSTTEYATWVGTPHSATSMVPIWQTAGSDWTEECYFKFNWAQMFNYPVNSVFGIFGIDQLVSTSQPLIHIVNGAERLEINIEGDEVSYRFNDDEPFFVDIIPLFEKFVVGFNIEKLSQYFGSGILPFFTSTGNTNMYVAGDGSSTFEGKIYKISVMNANNYKNLINGDTLETLDNEWAFTSFFNQTVDGGIPSSSFDDQVDGGVANDLPMTFFNSYGIAEQVYKEDFHDIFTMYSLIPMYSFNRLFLDIEVGSDWEEYFPLNYFATYVKDSDLNSYYDLDSLQINLGYANRRDYITIATEQDSWIYGSPSYNTNLENLYDSYNEPTQKTYATLDNEIITNYETYENLRRKAEIQKVLDFNKSSLKGYITFQFLNSGFQYPLSNYVNTKFLDQSRVIVADDVNLPTNNLLAYETKFEFSDNTVVYPPSTQTVEGADLSLENMVMVMHLQIRHKGILSNPIQIRDLEISSRTSNQTIPTEIGTKYGTSIYPYVKEGDVFKYKDYNPVVIYKKNTPYLYTTSRSGVKVGNTSVGEKQYGVRVPINEAKTIDFEVAAIQFWAKYDYTKFANNGMSIMEVDYLDNVYEVVVYKDFSPQRGVIRLRNKITKTEFTAVDFYQNGIYVKNPVIKINDWNSIGITFQDPLSFDSYSGSINLLSGVTFNNVSYYLPNGLGRLSNVLTRPWLRVLRSETNPNQALTWYDWYYLDPIAKTKNAWKQVYIENESTSYLFSPEDIHKTYIGTNKSIVYDDQVFNISNKDFSVINEVSWLRYSNKPI